MDEDQSGQVELPKLDLTAEDLERINQRARELNVAEAEAHPNSVSPLARAILAGETPVHDLERPTRTAQGDRMIVELKNLQVQAGSGGVFMAAEVGTITYQEGVTPEDVTNSRIEPGATLRVLVEDEYAVYIPAPVVTALNQPRH